MTSEAVKVDLVKSKIGKVTFANVNRTRFFLRLPNQVEIKIVLHKLTFRNTKMTSELKVLLVKFGSHSIVCCSEKCPINFLSRDLHRRKYGK